MLTNFVYILCKKENFSHFMKTRVRTESLFYKISIKSCFISGIIIRLFIAEGKIVIDAIEDFKIMRLTPTTASLSLVING